MNRPRMTQSLEDYLETIHRLTQGGGGVRAVDIATALQVKKPSVNNAVKELAKLGYIEYARYQRITLTPEGEKMAALIYQRHHLLKHFLLSIGVPEPTAEADACAMEHILSATTLARIESLYPTPPQN